MWSLWERLSVRFSGLGFGVKGNLHNYYGDLEKAPVAANQPSQRHAKYCNHAAELATLLNPTA